MIQMFQILIKSKIVAQFINVNHMKKFLFFYLMKNKANEIKLNAPKHSLYWKSKNLNSYEGGPFSDFSGGCITFSTVNMKTAQDLIMNDPFMIKGCIREYWIKEWLIRKKLKGELIYGKSSISI